MKIQKDVLAGTLLLGSSACDQHGSEARCKNNSNMANSSTPGFINTQFCAPGTPHHIPPHQEDLMCS